jgi:hypothetical protein
VAASGETKRSTGDGRGGKPSSPTIAKGRSFCLPPLLLLLVVLLRGLLPLVRP